MAYEDLINNAPTAATLRYNGAEKTVYFRRLTAREDMTVKKGQKGTVKQGESSFELDLGDVAQRNHLILSYSNVTEDGKPVFRSVSDVDKLPADFVNALLAARGEAIKDDEAGN